MKRMHTLRARLSALALAAIAIAVVLLTVVFNVVLTRSLDADVNRRLRSAAAAALTTVVVRPGGALQIRESPSDATLDREVWVYRGHHAVERARAPAALQRAADRIVSSGGRYKDVLGKDVRLHTAPIRSGRRQVGTVVTAVPLSAYDRTLDVALAGSVGLGLLLMAVAAGVMWAVIGRALRPVEEMTRQAGDWSEHEPGGRFGSAPRPDELGRLAATFDALLDRVAASLRHEQRFSAEVSHELRTPLSKIQAETELLLRRERDPAERQEALQVVSRGAQQMSGILDSLMAAARADADGPPGRGDASVAIARAVEAGEGTGRHPVELRLGATPLWVGVDQELIERILAPLLENARRFADSRAWVTATREGRNVVVCVFDDGPGIAPDQLARIFDPGYSSGQQEHDGAGLGLSLARRLARAAGGDVSAAARSPGAELRVTLPEA